MTKNPFVAIGKAVKRVAVLIAHGFVKLFGEDAAHALADATEKLLKSALGKIVWAAVTALMEASIPGAEKRAQAFANVVAAAKAAGLEASASEINLAIELLYQKAKGTFGPDPNATPETAPDDPPDAPVPPEN